MENQPIQSIPNVYEAMTAVILNELQKKLDMAVLEIKESVKAINMPDEQQALSVNEAAKILGVHRDTIMSMIKRCDLDAKRTGVKYLIPRKSLKTYIENSRPEAAPAIRGTK
jgi:excisionase family DNA binding protein